jgi:hypothetical protein
MPKNYSTIFFQCILFFFDHVITLKFKSWTNKILIGKCLTNEKNGCFLPLNGTLRDKTGERRERDELC